MLDFEYAKALAEVVLDTTCKRGLGLYEVDDKTCINEINKKGKSKWKKKRMSCGYWNRKKLPISRTAM